MISFSLSEQQAQIKEVTHWFAANEMRPIALEAEKLGKVPDDWLYKINQMGIQLNTSFSSSSKEGKGESRNRSKRREGQGNRMAVIASEEMAWGDPAIALSLPGAGLGGPPIESSGTEEQKERFLSIFTADEPRWGAYALTEPEAGSDASAIRTTAKKVDGGYILNGEKIFITNGKRASWVVVFATVDASLARAGHRAFVVEKGTPGYTCSRLVDKMGLRANETAELLFEDCFVPTENLLGGEELYEHKKSQGSGFETAMATFDSTRPIVAAMATGIARAAFEYVLEVVQQNYPKLLQASSRYGVQQTLAEMEQNINAARLLTWEAAYKADLGLSNAKEAAICKAFAGEMALKVCQQALAIIGPTSIESNLVEKWYRDVKVFDLFEGTNEIQKLVIARRQYSTYGIRV
ncbi:MAG TPA: acyl-CoA dehydrogenase family protein [Pseudogracilibacillus sp.]|nr:acyl-CoA dehydrogenase family protein [Pseudogracilibacillus sp.]